MPALKELSIVNFVALREAPEQRAELLRNVTALLSMVADRCEDRLLAIYDSVLVRLAEATEPAVRAEIAQRLSELRRGPGGIVRRLALDEIAIAYPLLVRSPMLAEADLVGIAQLRGNPHRRAIASRPLIGAVLTALLVERGDQSVRLALAGNPTAEIARAGYGRLLECARGDEVLQQLLADNPGTPEGVLKALGVFAVPAVRETVDARLTAGDHEETAGRVAEHAMFAVYDFAAAVGRLETWIEDDNRLDIAAVAEFAAGNRFDEAVVALARLSGFALVDVLDWFAERDTRTVLLVVRALGGSEADFTRILSAGAWRFRIPADRRAEAMAAFRATAPDRAQVLLEERVA